MRLVKAVVVGDCGVGKSSIMDRLMNDAFERNKSPGVGVEFHTHTYKINHRSIKVQFWDAAGADRFASSRQVCYLGAVLFVIVFDMTNSLSFKHLDDWVREIRWIGEGSDFSNKCMAVLIANKADMQHLRAVSDEEARTFARTHNMLYYEMSAKDADGVHSSWQSVLHQLDERDLQDREAGNEGYTKEMDFAPSYDGEEVTDEDDVGMAVSDIILYPYERRCCHHHKCIVL